MNMWGDEDTRHGWVGISIVGENAHAEISDTLEYWGTMALVITVVVVLLITVTIRT